MEKFELDNLTKEERMAKFILEHPAEDFGYFKFPPSTRHKKEKIIVFKKEQVKVKLRDIVDTQKFHHRIPTEKQCKSCEIFFGNKDYNMKSKDKPEYCELCVERYHL